MKDRTPFGRQLAAWFGPRLRTLRQAHALTQYGLARKAGLLRGAVASYEAGRAVPSLEACSALARGLGIPVRVVIDGIDDVIAKGGRR